jgi:tetratricopeptide (TPR) repeat protein
MKGARYWTGRSMEWALEVGDRLMMSWVLYRRGEHAATDGESAAVAGLAAAARREGGDLPGPMLAAILQQEAHAHALDGDEAACQLALDQAYEQAAVDDPGDASNGHGSFCTPAYVEMQRGRCWLRLGRPAKARIALDRAVRSLAPVYRRDRGVALSALATAFAAIGEPAEAAAAATQALAVARDAGSERIVGMVIPVATSLAPYSHLQTVARLQEVLRGATHA